MVAAPEKSAVTSSSSSVRRVASACAACAASSARSISRSSVTSRRQPIVPVGLPSASVVTWPQDSIDFIVWPSGQITRVRRTYDDRSSIALFTISSTSGTSSGWIPPSHASNVRGKVPGA